MKCIKLLFWITISIGCNSNKIRNEKEIAEVKANNNKRIELIKSLPEPFYSKVPDTMKKWIPILRNVYADDQKNRIVGVNTYTETEKKEQLAIDSQNLKIVCIYLDKYGWPTLYDVGLLGQRAINMTIQHAPLKQQEKYYPELVKAFKKDSLLFETVALLEDRINVRNHRLQYYGSQMIVYKGKQIPYPIVNVDSINIFRKQIGFKMTIENYFTLLKMKCDLKDYKVLLPELRKELKVSDTTGIHYIRS